MPDGLVSKATNLTKYPIKGGGLNSNFCFFHCIFTLSVTLGEMENSKSDEASGDKDDDTKDRRKTPEVEVSRLRRRIPGEKSFNSLVFPTTHHWRSRWI